MTRQRKKERAPNLEEQFMLDKKWITTKEACVIANRSESWARVKLSEGKIHEKIAQKCGGRWFWNRLLIERFGMKLKTDPMSSDFLDHAYPAPEGGKKIDEQ